VPDAVKITLDASAYKAAISELNLKLNRLRYIPKALGRRCFKLLNIPAKLCRIETRTTGRASTTVFLKPSNSLANLLSALRASDRQRFIIK
jgi:hypothetical protein